LSTEDRVRQNRNLLRALIADVRRLADTLLERANDLAQRREPSGPGTSNR